MWFANVTDDPAVFLNNEPPWPVTAEQCSGNRVFITHRIDYADGWNFFQDGGHLGGQGDMYAPKAQWKKGVSSVDQPIGYADGHVEVRDKNAMDYRALYSGANIIY